MKKIFIILSAVVTMLFCVVPLAAYADSSDDPNYGTYDEFRSGYNISSNSSEFICKYHIINSSNQTFYFTSGFSIPKDQYSEYIDTAVMNGSIFDLRLKKPVNFFVGHRDFQFNVNQNWSISVLRLSFDTSSNILNLYDENNNLITKDFFTGEQFSPIVIDDYTTNFKQFITEPITVELFPELTMDFDYTAEFMGETYPMQLLQVDIKNNTASNYQYAIIIQPEGSGFDTEVHGNSKNKMIFWGESNITYALMRDEWCYIPGDGRSTSYNGWELYNTPSPWHFVGANDYKREQIYFDQMKLKKGQNYVFKVFAYNQTENTFNGFYGLDTNNKVFSTGGYPLTPLYTKTFSVIEDTEFNSNNYSNGIYSFDPDAPLDTQFDKVKAVYDTSIADFKITDSGTYDSIYDSKPNKIDKYAFNDTKSVNSTFDNLVTQSSSYFLLLLSVFNYFPAWFTALLFTGMLGIIIVFIIKKI